MNGSRDPTTRQTADAACRIVEEFTDGTGQRRVVSPGSRAALVEAMGVSSRGNALPSDERVLVVRQGRAIELAAPGQLVFEDGTAHEVKQIVTDDLPLGYHCLHRFDNGQSTRVIVCPQQCFFDQALHTWAWAIQLYSVRSRQSWGIGDLADLRCFARWSSSLGAGLVLLGPLNAVAPVTPQQASPYFPASRLYRNPIYLRVEEVPRVELAGIALECLSTEARALSADPLVDRDAVFQRKLTALERIWSNGVDEQELNAFCQQQGESLQQFAAYCVLAEKFGGDWRRWPERYSACRSAAVRRFAEQHRNRVRYYQWLQWLLDEQLKQAAAEVPLVHDLPLGFDPGGFDAWTWKDLLAEKVTIGAPPDDFNPHGQDWGLPPFVPHKLRAAAYEPFIKTLRASFRHAAGMRIDHIMGLFRQYWIPSGFEPTDGAYVTFPAEELLAILALESDRAGAWVVGEDLGTAPEGMREQLAEQRILSYRLLWFEHDPPAQYPVHSVAAVTTHDLPTVAGLWNGVDLAELRSLGIEPANASLDKMRQHFAELAGLSTDAPAEQAIENAYRMLGQAPSALLLATLEDALAVEQRPNLPGTVEQRTNWSLALPVTLEDLPSTPLPQRIVDALSRSP